MKLLHYHVIALLGLSMSLAQAQPELSAADAQRHLRILQCGLIELHPGLYRYVPVRVLSALFRRLFLAQLRQAFANKKLNFYKALAALEDPQAFAKHLAPVANADWVVYAKKSFGGPEQVLEYLGRYAHRVAISNNRLLNFADGHVDLKWKDYRQESQPKVMRLQATEFVRRFLLHVLPSGFQRIRHYGLLANCHREVKLEKCRQLLQAPPPLPIVAPGQLERFQRSRSAAVGHIPCRGSSNPSTRAEPARSRSGNCQH